ncbi:MAG: phytanoyl-CoA dioxygenase family protein [Pseudomonadota bacterium]
MIFEQDQNNWSQKGWVAFPALLPPATVGQLSGWAEAMAETPSADEERLQYYEATPFGPRLCRTERFLSDNRGLEEVITGASLLATATALLGGQAVLYKEKINYKAPGGAGFAAHQDATAYAFASCIVTCLLAVDPMTPENGCLEFASGFYDDMLAQDEQGCLPSHLADDYDWEPVSLPAGGAVFFSSLVPHRSGPNRSDSPRRALYLTYNLLAEGDFRAGYYAERSRQMAAASSQRDGVLRISNIGHFQGQAWHETSVPDAPEQDDAEQRRANS